MKHYLGLLNRVLAVGLLALSPHVMAQHAPRSVDDVIALLDQYKPDAARLAAARALLERPVPTGSLRQTLIAFHRERAAVAEEFAMAERELHERRLALEAGQGTGDEVRLINELSSRERAYGNYSHAKALFDRQLHLSGGEPYMQLLARLAMVGAESGDIATAKSYFAKAEAAYRVNRTRTSSSRNEHFDAAFIECVRAQMLNAQGHLAEAEQAYRVSIASILKDLEIAEARSRVSSRTVAGIHGVYNHCESLLVNTLSRQGRIAEAEYTIRNQIRRILANTAGLAPTAVIALTQLAGVVLQRGQWKDAESLARAALRVSAWQGARADSLFSLDARRLLANILLGQSLWTDALNEFQEIHRIAGTGGAQQQ